MVTNWRRIQRQNFTDWKKFFEFVEIDPPPFFKTHFPLNIPQRLAAKIKKKDPLDPIFKQFAPSSEEQKASSLFVLDPVQDQKAKKTPKLLHKYHGRALLLPTSACAMHCRYCFRQHFPYATQETSLEAEIQYLKEDTSLEEVLLSGGDPLSLSDTSLEKLLQALDSISHLKRLRFHTRFPIGIPERISDAFLQLLENRRLQVFFVIHVNHLQELDEEIFSYLKKVQRLGIPILSQSVLLKGINDDVKILKELFLTLSNHGILPYYLHQLDRVQGALHFEVPEEQGKILMQKLQTKLPGFALPRYVKEIGGMEHKTFVQ